MRCSCALVVLLSVVIANEVIGSEPSTILSRHSKKGHSKKGHARKGHGKKTNSSVCDDPEFRKASLKLVKHAPAIGLFPDLKNHTKFEASGIVIAKGAFWVIFDSSYSLGRVDLDFAYGGKNNELLGERGDDSGIEDLAYVSSRDTFLMHREGVEGPETDEISTYEIKVNEDTHDYSIVKKCTVEFKPDPRYPNKGFEGIHYFDINGKEYLMALCEGNFCTGGKTGKTKGNGRLVISTFYEDSTGCEWKTAKVLSVPEEAYFIDYAGIDFRGNQVAIVSQESSALWLGQFDFEALEFVGTGKVFHFPRDRECNIQFCNVEGVAFIDAHRVAVASDKAKALQPYGCTLTDQAVQIFAIPGHDQGGVDEEDEDDDEAELVAQ